MNGKDGEEGANGPHDRKKQLFAMQKGKLSKIVVVKAV